MVRTAKGKLIRCSVDVICRWCREICIIVDRRDVMRICSATEHCLGSPSDHLSICQSTQLSVLKHACAVSVTGLERLAQHKKQEVRTTDNSRPLRPHIQGHSRSFNYPIENLYIRLLIAGSSPGGYNMGGGTSTL